MMLIDVEKIGEFFKLPSHQDTVGEKDGSILFFS